MFSTSFNILIKTTLQSPSTQTLNRFFKTKQQSSGPEIHPSHWTAPQCGGWVGLPLPSPSRAPSPTSGAIAIIHPNKTTFPSWKYHEILPLSHHTPYKSILLSHSLEMETHLPNLLKGILDPRICPLFLER